MSKKTFSQAPKPRQLTDEQIAAYEQGGAGHDTAVRAAPPVQAKPPAEPTKRLSLDLPASMHTRFKTACSATGRKMVAELQAYIAQRTAELEDEAGLTRK